MYTSKFTDTIVLLTDKIATKDHNTHGQLISYIIERLQISGYHTKTYTLTTHQIISEHETHNYNTVLKIFNVTRFTNIKTLKEKSKPDTEMNIITLICLYSFTTFMSVWFILLVCCKLHDNTS